VATETDDELFESLRGQADEVTLKSRAMDAAPIGITIADMQAEGDPLIYVNEGFEDLTGYSLEEVVGDNCRFLQGEETREEPVRRMREAIEAGESVQVELRNYQRDGTPFWNDVRLAPITVDDEIPYYVGFQQDITLRKEHQRHLERQRDDLDILNQMVRHDIRNDLQVVLGSLELLRPHAPEAVQEQLDVALDRTDQAISLTQAAAELAETMLSTGTTLEPVPLLDNLAAEIEDARSFDDDATVQVDGDLPAVEVRADDMLDAVFRNILQNGIKHNDSDQPEMTVSAAVDDDRVRVAIADNGPGVPDRQKETIFGKGAGKTKPGSAGVGLYLVSRLVDNYDGTIHVEDNEPRGAVFVVRLQIA
jgi:PAS domain S-box-containing protein